MNSTRNITIAKWGLGVMLITNLTAFTPASAGVAIELAVVGNPYSPVPEPFASDNFDIQGGETPDIGNAWVRAKPSMSFIAGLSEQGNSIVIKPKCTDDTDPDHDQDVLLVQTELDQAVAYQHQENGSVAKVCDKAGSTIESFELRIISDANQSCLVSGQPGQIEGGTYNLTRVKPTNSDFGDGTYDFGFSPLNRTTPAWIATKNGAVGSFTSADVRATAEKWVFAAYLPASRPCDPPSGPSFSGTTPYATASGRLGVTPASKIEQVQAQVFTTTVPLPSGGGGLYNEQQTMADAPGVGILGYKRLQALPLNSGDSGSTPWGGVRKNGTYVQCGANNGQGAGSQFLVTIETRCRMAGLVNAATAIGGIGNTPPRLGVRVDTGGGAFSNVDGFQHWRAAGWTNEVGQHVRFRSREVSWVGYGLHSPVTQVTMTDGN